MEAGFLYTAVGPWVLVLLFLLFVFVSFRRPLEGCLLYAAYLLAMPYVTYRPDLQALGSGMGILVLAAAALVRSPPGRLRLPAAADRWMALFALVVGVAAVRGALSGHARALIAADLYHYVLAGPLVYFAFRSLIPQARVRVFLSLYLVLATCAALATILLLRSANVDKYVWLVGSPLDEGGFRIKPDFAFPVFALLVASAALLDEPRPGIGIAILLLSALLVLTYKRTLWAAFLIGLLVVWLLPMLRSRRPIAKRTQRLRRVSLLLLFTAGGAALSVFVGLNQTSALRRSVELTRPGGVETYQVRRTEWREAVSLVLERPLGWGLGAAPPLSRDTGDSEPTHHIHNMYLQWSVQAGVQTTLAALGLLGAFLIAVWRRRKVPPAPALGASIAALAVAGFSVLSFYTPMAGVFLALGVTLDEGLKTASG